MYKSVLIAAVCALSSVACEFACFGDCDDDWSDESQDPQRAGGSARRGSEWRARTLPAVPAARGAIRAAARPAVTPEGPRTLREPEVIRYRRSRRATKKAIANEASTATPRNQCVAADAETCPELRTEANCDNRNDCVSIYAGTNCSCGPECTCIGGEPGCVCENFAFFTCEPLGGLTNTLRPPGATGHALARLVRPFRLARIPEQLARVALQFHLDDDPIARDLDRDEGVPIEVRGPALAREHDR